MAPNRLSNEVGEDVSRPNHQQQIQQIECPGPLLMFCVLGSLVFYGVRTWQYWCRALRLHLSQTPEAADDARSGRQSERSP